MKFATAAIFPLLVAGSTVPPERRDPKLAHGHLAKRDLWDTLGSYITSNIAPILLWSTTQYTWLMKWQESPVKFKTMEPEIDRKALKTTLTYGPFYLKGTDETDGKARDGMQMDPKSTVFVRTLKGFPWNAAILSAKPAMVFEDGRAADFASGVYVHHFLVSDNSKPSAPFALCFNMHKEDNIKDWVMGYIMENIGAGLIQVGNDAYGGPNIFMPQKGDLKAAFLTNKDDLFGMQAEIVNYNKKNVSVFLNMELEYLEEKPKDYLDASTIVLSATGCRDPGYRPPPGEKQYNHTSENFEVTQDGYIVNARGHLHDGGTAIELWLNDKMVCRSLPKYGKVPGSQPDVPETIVEMSWCHESTRIKKGDKMQVKTYYDVNLHPLRKEAGKDKGGNGTMPGMSGGGHGHSGHGNSAAPEGGESGMEGMEEMGIMTTNFAWDIGSKEAQAAKAAKEKGGSVMPSTSWLSSIFGSIPMLSPQGGASPANSASGAAPTQQSWSEYLGSFFSSVPAAGPSAPEPAPAPSSPSPSPSPFVASPSPAAPSPIGDMPSGHSHS